ncbi:MAG: A/G-specific adenine glycosylase, partial [Bradymonadaceae bacterium]
MRTGVMMIMDEHGWAETALNEYRERLLDWFNASRRDLPWREIADPYAIWVSEVMLQQTQVVTVIDYFERWMERFPTVEVLAESSLEAVLEVWAGLGYYRRARFLHRAARDIVEIWGGELPTTVDELRTLPGVGAYTAGAVASIAFGQPTPVVDGNVNRVLARLFCLEGDLSRGSSQRLLWELAAELVDEARPGDFNQAMMELGSTVCTPRQPGCGRCPVENSCAAKAMGEAERYPQPSKRSEQRRVMVRTSVVVAMTHGERRFLVVQRPAEGLLGGMWQFPSLEKDGEGAPTLGAMASLIESHSGLRAKTAVRRRLGKIVHHFSHLKWKVEADLLIFEETKSPLVENDEG